MENDNESKHALESFYATYQEMIILSKLRHEPDFINDASQRYVLYSAINSSLSKGIKMPINAKEISSDDNNVNLKDISALATSVKRLPTKVQLAFLGILIIVPFNRLIVIYPSPAVSDSCTNTKSTPVG